MPPKRARRPKAERSKASSLGRVYSVWRETWALQDDPQETRPEIEVIATRRTAAEAADLAREAAAAFRKRGFHKPSGAWWGADDTAFHRFRVTGAGRPPGLVLAVASAAAGLALVALLRPRRKTQEPPAT